MAAISSYQQIPSGSPISDQDGNITYPWHLFLMSMSSGSQAYSHIVPVTGFNITIPVGITNLILDPVTVLETGTVVMPASATDGQIVTISTSNTITSATISANAGQSIVNAPSTITSTGVSFIFVQSVGTWYRKQ
jgi:hypothetical protein